MLRASRPTTRVILARDGNGRAVVKIDEVATHVFSRRPGVTACHVWTTEGFPANNDSDADLCMRKVASLNC